MHPLQQRYVEAYQKSPQTFPVDKGLLKFTQEQLKKYNCPLSRIVLGAGKDEFTETLKADSADWVEEINPTISCNLAQYWPANMNRYQVFIDAHLSHCLVGADRANFWKNFHGRKGRLIGESAIWDKRVFLPIGYERLDDGTIQAPNGHKERTLLTAMEFEQELLFTLGEIEYFYVRQDRRLILNEDFIGHPVEWCPPVVQYVVKLAGV